MIIAGIDFGSKLAGTTVIAYWDTETPQITWQMSAKKQDADVFLFQILVNLQPALVLFDAPLSLPQVYQFPNIAEKDYFFRKCDRVLRAMSPMFLGGLTARAMQLKTLLKTKNIPLYETYPAQQAQRLELQSKGYKQEKEHILAIQTIILEDFEADITLQQTAQTWHEIDALLALLTAYRFQKGIHQTYGEASEGQIFI